MREQETKSLLLVEADPAERRLVSAVAARAGWITVGADCIETAVGLGLAAQRTRKLAILGLIGYLLYLTGNAVRNR